MWGQAGWAYDNIGAGIAVAVLFALAIESIGIYLAWEAHEALLADQASGLLRLGSYAVGGFAGLLNYWHFAPTNLAQAWAFAGLSAISPVLWGIWSRARNRTRLAELGMVDPRGVKLSTSRKAWHPVKSWHVTRHAAWTGETNPLHAVVGWEDAQQEERQREARQEADRQEAERVAKLPKPKPKLPSSRVKMADRSPEDQEKVRAYNRAADAKRRAKLKGMSNGQDQA